jgi:hypothetical protein
MDWTPLIEAPDAMASEAAVCHSSCGHVGAAAPRLPLVLAVTVLVIRFPTT